MTKLLFLSIILLLFFFLLVFSPLLLTFKESLTLDGKISFSLYREILKDARLRLIFGRTIWVGIATAVTVILVGLPLSYILERTLIPFRKIFSILYLFPLLIPPYILGFSWIISLQNKGFLRDFLSEIGLGVPFFLNLYNLKGIIFVLTLSYFPFACLFITAGLRNIDRRMEESGEVIASPLKSFRKITLPLLFPYLLVSFIFVFILSLSEYVLFELLRVHNYTFELYYQFSAFHNFAKATALAFPIVFITLFLVLIMEKIMSERPYVSLTGSYRPAPSRKMPLIIKVPAFIFVSTVIILSVIFPLGVFIKGTGSIKNLCFAFSSSLNEILLSLFLAILGATLCTLLSLPLAHILEDSKGGSKKLINILTLIPLAMPGPVIGLGLVRLWNRPQTLLVGSTFIAIMLAYLARFSCYGIRIISSALRTYSKEIKEAALVIPASKIKRFFKITLPLIHPAVIITWLVSFVFCIIELSATLFIIPPGETTFIIRIESFFHHGDIQSIFAMCLAQVLIAIIPVLFLIPYAKFRTKYVA